MSVSPTPDPVSSLRETVRAQLQGGQMAAAESSYRQLLEHEPDDVDALVFLADRELARRNAPQAILLLSRAERAHPDHPGVAHQLGSVHLASGDFEAAASHLQRALAAAPSMFLARLRLGIALEQLGRAEQALTAYFMAVRSAQEQGRWLSDATTAPGLRELVKYAMNYANAGRQRLFDAALEPLRERYGRSELRRVDRALAIHLGLEPMPSIDPRQRPLFLYFPDIPSQPFYPRERFPWHETLEAAAAAVREELLAVLAGEQVLESFLGVDDPTQAQSMLRGSDGHAAAWDAYFFHRHGDRYEDHCAACPRTSAVLDAVPLVRIRDHAPEALFSVLRPGTHILPHRGVTNTRLVTHLPLIVPSDCALRVGGQIHSWREGSCVTFDDTFEHEAWNRSQFTRVVLILDSWNPDLSEAEQAAVTDLVEAIGDFNASCAVTADPA
ncbi:aspartyl/asparaginyl beta-hydroxylase domain-containing protein [Rhodanobacter denitrificans]|uniref:Aspartyl/asparaginyl beta-hydroxylase-like dioxygenase n=1 Tax=Rhodanobacter denitrificans TaxID=666685 RepID=M4NI38_9GAMM|nr:aspartyl/asparaginyl beta-hydroxylase domain-containing protein [Rhodanobacter denitrificans]AGG90554.1 aspartyl/asparaginyl beta-hydroxylase-like dioxygenase [Rhodanobacter denitrificans]UJJ50641.1 aspartyl/asparaginyl beta-hydroxylase domain-containing protein [Rhodanobacter denitrificans]UJJ57171.1 aspartyl/asparaginyl beta-hydroxylase domain-containing protein [Rhodanobacter denitrificans]UJM85937.1 aspartyl/asparaginyl beta-hydroxylase domain-containing protein [Rhodanobacter denitrific